MPGAQQTSEQLALAVVDRGEQALARAQAVARKIQARVCWVLRGGPPAAHRPDVQPPSTATKDSSRP
jgi:hypothetical protein